jgi:hypothetical protein
MRDHLNAVIFSYFFNNFLRIFIEEYEEITLEVSLSISFFFKNSLPKVISLFFIGFSLFYYFPLSSSPSYSIKILDLVR